MTALVSIRCDTELDDGSFCIGSKVSNGPTTRAELEAIALRQGWTEDGGCHYCPTCSVRASRPRYKLAATAADYLHFANANTSGIGREYYTILRSEFWGGRRTDKASA